jgi:hypothetical protein
LLAESAQPITDLSDNPPNFEQQKWLREVMRQDAQRVHDRSLDLLLM